jgi:hypothetical protein
LRHFGIGNKKELQQKRCRELEEDLLLQYWSSILVVQLNRTGRVFSAVIMLIYSLSFAS